MPQKSSLSHLEFLKRVSVLYRKAFFGKFSAKSKKSSSADTLLKYAGMWSGNDLEDCLQEVIQSRGEAQF